jgi:hypothetical protein
MDLCAVFAALGLTLALCATAAPEPEPAVVIEPPVIVEPEPAQTVNCPSAKSTDRIPGNAARYRQQLIQAAQSVMGLDAPIAVLAGQIHQESAWRPDVCSKYACGLTQFTKDTADWISGKYADLSANNRMSPRWAIMALVRYDDYLFGLADFAATDFDRWAFALSGYNGGWGWVGRDRKICKAAPGCDSTRWFGHVENHTRRADWAKKENRHYPDAILRRWQPLYAEGWMIDGMVCQIEVRF